MTTDKNKGLQTVEYNHLNLPMKLTGKDGKTIEYIYDANGVKLAKIAPNGVQTIYSGSFVYENDAISYVLHAEGKYDMGTQGNGGYQYFLKDHLGNTRVVVNEAGDEIQQTAYYPFGMEFIGTKVEGGTNNKYLYNGKELQDDQIGNGQLDWYDYGARFYDAAIGRWHVIDPMSEIARRWTPYQYCYNNPLRYIDPDGMVVDDYFNQDGEYLGPDDAETDNVKIMDQSTWDKNKTVNEDGSESIVHEVGEVASVDHSKANLSEDATLKVYDHYNPTNLDVVAHDAETGAAGLTFSYKISTQKIKVKIEGNKREGTADHANEIKNAFVHEEQHYKDFQRMGYDNYKAASSEYKESRAITTQMNHPTWEKTRKKNFQDPVIRYGEKKGMMFKILPIGL